MVFSFLQTKNKIFSTKSVNDEDHSVTTIPPRTFKLERLNDEIKRKYIEEGYFTEENYAFVIEPTFSSLASIIEIKQNFLGSQNAFVSYDTI